MQVRLEVAHQKANVKRVVLKQDAVIGRSADCSLRIASSLVSRQHCKFTITEEAVMVRDLGSSNGTFVNGTKLAPNQDYEIEPNSQLSVGGVMFVVRFDAPVAAVIAPAPLPTEPPGSTVDLPVTPRPRREKKSDELTAEWSPAAVAAVTPALAETASYSSVAAAIEEKARQKRLAEESAPVNEESNEATVAATPEQLAEDPDGETAMGLEDAPPIVEDAAVEATSESVAEVEPVEELDPVEVVEEVSAAEVETAEAPVDTERAGSSEAVVVDAAMAEQEVVSAHAGDVLDAGMLDSTPAPGSPFAFNAPPAAAGDWNVGEGFSEASASDPEASATPASIDDSSKKKKKLFGLFGLFGKKDKSATPPAAPVETNEAGTDTAVFTELPSAEQPVVAQAIPAGPVAAVAIEEGAFVTEVVEAVVVEAIPVVGEVAPSAAIVAVATAVPAEGVVEAGVEVDPYDTVSVAVPVAAVAAPPAASPAPADDDGFGDFLKQIGQ
jgi:hypothetical protein